DDDIGQDDEIEQNTEVMVASDTLMLHQLRLMEWLDRSGRRRSKVDEADDRNSEEFGELPPKWQLSKGITPHDWQRECIEAWIENDFRGTVKVVTGGGKTILALSMAEELQNEYDAELRVAIVVPTIVLMHQWRDVLLEKGNLPADAIGRLGGGYDDGLTGKHRILIAVLPTAALNLGRLVEEASVGEHLLLIVDECHRSGAAGMSAVLETDCKYSLGLSATPEREDDVDSGYNDSTVGQALGKIVFEFNLVDAIREGLVPKFTINHYGLPLTPEERNTYEKYSRSIKDARSKLAPAHRSSGTRRDLFMWVRHIAQGGQGDLSSLANRFITDSSRRRELLNRIKARHAAVEVLLEREFKVNPDARVILFHESIDEVMSLFLSLKSRGFPAIAEHSGLPASIRETGLELFRNGTAQIIVSAKSLIEGFNVPAVDVAIIVASSGSVRQRIQSLGRVLRRHRGPDGEEKTSCIHVLYAADTSEEMLYGKHDWDATTGIDQNRYYRWDPGGTAELQDGPPRTPLPTEAQVVPDSLEAGSVYPGKYEGAEYSCDTKQNIKNSAGEFIQHAGELVEQVVAVKGNAGKFKVTPRNLYVLVRIPIPGQDDWETRFVTRLTESLELQVSGSACEATTDAEIDAWALEAASGSDYPFTEAKPVTALKFRQRGGGKIAKRVSNGEVYAQDSGHADDVGRGKDAELAIAAILSISAAGKQVTKLELNARNDLLFRESGKLKFICRLSVGFEFPR
ncbi:MAG: DEAD/DEAH box helicase, partial [Pirellulales bacterium]